jgi:hypothetical protein
MIMSRDQNSRTSLNKKIVNRSFEKVLEFKYLVTTFTNQRSIQEETKSRIKSGNACNQSVHNLLFSKNMNIKIYRTIILSVVLYGCETSSIKLREERRLRVFENNTSA